MTNLSGTNLNNGAAVGPQGEGRESPSTFPAYPTYKDSGVEWLGVVPEHWGVSPLKWLVEQVTDKATTSDFQVGLENIEGWTGRFIETDTEFAGDGIAFRQEDILFGKLRPYLAKVWLAGKSGQAVGDFFVLRPRAVNSEFLHKYILTPAVIEDLNASTIGAKMPRVGWEDMAALAVTLPPDKEQTQIARFLDHETARIDALIEEQQRLIELLKEKRQAVISHAVTKGLDPTVPMKDSGVEWLGEVPAHWAVCQVRHLMVGDTRNGLYKPEGEKDPDGVGFVQMGEAFRDRIFQGGVKDRVQASNTELKNWGLEEGDLLFARRSIVLEGSGRCTRVGSLNEPHLFESSMIRIRLDLNRVSPEYLHLMFDSIGMRAQVLSTTKTVTISGIDSGQLKGLRVAVPAKSEQENIAAYLLSRIEAFDDAERAAMETTLLLQERRSALISAAVTGKIDVRGWQPQASALAPELAKEAV